MADDVYEDDERDQSVEVGAGGESDAEHDRAVEGETDEAAGEEPEVDDGESVELDSDPRWTARRDANRAVFGRLVLHFPVRDVTIELDGDAAMRLLTMFKHREGGLGDLLHPFVSRADAGWVVLDIDESMAMSWMPMRSADRTAIDPAFRAAA